MTAIITQGNALDLHLPDESVDLVVTSPPYFGLRSYTDAGSHYAGQIGDEETPGEYLDHLIAATAEAARVLRPGGSIFVNLGDKYAERRGPARAGGVDDDDRIRRPADRPARGRRGDVRVKSLLGLPWRYALRCVDELGLILRAEIVWAKPNAMPESITDRVRRSHEQVFHLTRSPRYLANLDELREPLLRSANGAVFGGRKAIAAAEMRGSSARRSGANTYDHANELGKLPASVWEIPTVPLRVPEHLGVDHFAAYPPDLVRRIVLGWSPAGGVVLDPFGGTGTTALVASCFGRVGISVDLSADYCRLAQWRTSDSAERARALGVAKPVEQLEGQLGLYEGLPT